MDVLTRLTDEGLVKRYALGDSKAFEELLFRHQSKVFAYIYLFVRDRELAEDIFQDTFMKAIVTIQQGKYVETGKFPSWLNRIAHNLIVDHFRRERNENTFPVSSAGYDIMNDGKLSEKSVEDVLSNEQVLQDVAHLVTFLPDVQQRVVRMRYFEGLSFKEIADRTGVSINTALGRMRYALINMRRMALESNIHLELK